MARSAEIGAGLPARAWLRALSVSGFSVPEGETAFSYLYQLAHDGLLRRYRPVTKQALKQLTHELDVIERTNLAEFFLIVWDLMEFARKGRSSARAGERRRLDRGLLPGHHQGRPDRAQAPLRALHQRGACAARHRHRLRRQPARGGDPVPLRHVRRRPRGHGLHDRHVPRPERRARGGQGARLPGGGNRRAGQGARHPRTPATSPATSRSTVSSAGSSTSSGSTWPMRPMPPGRDGRGTSELVRKCRTRRGTIRPRPTSTRSRSARATGAGKRPQVLDGPRRSVRAAGIRRQAARARRIGHLGAARVGDDEALRALRRAGWDELAGAELAVPTPRDNGSPGPSTGRPSLVRVDPSRGCRSRRRRIRVVPESRGGRHPARTPAGGPGPLRNRWQWLLQLCAEIDGFPRHLGIHVGGMLVTRRRSSSSSRSSARRCRTAS